MQKECVLFERKCTNCGECEVCDLNPEKRCDNCGECIEEVDVYRTVNIQEFEERMKDLDKFGKKKKKPGVSGKEPL